MCVECVYRCTSFRFMYLLFLCFFLLPYGVIKNEWMNEWIVNKVDQKRSALCYFVQQQMNFQRLNALRFRFKSHTTSAVDNCVSMTGMHSHYYTVVGIQCRPLDERLVQLLVRRTLIQIFPYSAVSLSLCYTTLIVHSPTFSAAHYLCCRFPFPIPVVELFPQPVPYSCHVTKVSGAASARVGFCIHLDGALSGVDRDHVVGVLRRRRLVTAGQCRLPTSTTSQACCCHAW